MNKNKFRYCTLLLINDDNHSKIFVSEKNKYYTRGVYKSIHIKILSEFEDIRKSYKFISSNMTDNYYRIDEPHIIKNCTILLIDDDDHSKVFFFGKKLYYTSNDCNNFGVDVDDYIFSDYEFFDEDYGDYDYYDDNNYDDDGSDYDDDSDDFYYDYDFYKVVYYKKSFNYFERLVSVKNNIVNLPSNNGYNQDTVLYATNFRISIIN